MANQVLLITGAGGFVGRALTTFLSRRPHCVVRAAARRRPDGLPASVEILQPVDISANPDWSGGLAGVDCVIHCAARAHIVNDPSADALSEFRRVNVEGTLSLARQAASAKVRRFIFISTIGVNGAETFSAPYTADDTAAPHSPYAISKHEAEIGLHRIAADTGIEVVIIRPPLIYGPDAPGNFGSLIRLVQRGLPLPLGAIHNRRSFIALDNLVDLLATCVDHLAAAGQTFLASDGEDLSTPDLVKRIGKALGRSVRLIPIPTRALRAAAVLAGRREMAQSLCGSLQVDISKTRGLLGWTPPLSVDAGLKKIALP